MEKIIYINTIALWILIILNIRKSFLEYYSVQINKTFWENKSYGITLYKKESKKVILQFNWRNPEKISDDLNKFKPE